jgi:hypothetical protein
MRKIMALLLTLTLTFLLFAGCGAATPSGSVKTGLAIISSISRSKDATADAEGVAEADSTIVAVTVDNSGKIVKCVIDEAQTQINFSTTGAITTDINSTFKTKQERGADYGMKQASTIGKEWNEEADAFASYAIGKTVSDIKGIAVNEEGAPTNADLASSVTISVGGFIAAIEKAVNNAKDLGAKAGDKLGIGVVTNIAKSTDAAADKEGLAQAYSSYTAATFDTSDKITSSIIDASQTDINFNAEGKITTDLKTELKTKQELGNDYGMKKASKIGKEWYEQVNALSDYIKGKTAAEVKGIAVNEEGVPTEADLTSSVTIHITDYTTIIEKAANNAKK